MMPKTLKESGDKDSEELSTQKAQKARESTTLERKTDYQGSCSKLLFS